MMRTVVALLGASAVCCAALVTGAPRPAAAADLNAGPVVPIASALASSDDGNVAANAIRREHDDAVVG